MEFSSSSAFVLENRDRLSKARVLTVGGASIEHGYTIEGELDADAKYSTEPQPRFAGGSSVNHACRLLAMGIDVHPVLPLAKSDPLSETIVSALGAAEKEGRARYRRGNLQIRGARLTTPYTTIIRQGGSRAALNEFSTELMERFRDHGEQHLAALAGARRPPDVVMLGHVHADRSPPARGEVGFGGAISERFLTTSCLEGARRYVNFGSAQFRLGTHRWEKLLRDRVSVFQLDIGEVRSFCGDAGLVSRSLESILDWFRERCTVVITLERFGAIGQLAGSHEPVAAWPYLLEDVRDSTGAGDAMGAGIVTAMLAQPFDDGEEPEETRLLKFAAALAFGRVCAAHACTTLGGASECPTLDALARFERRETVHLRDGGLTRSVSSHELFLIDRAFGH
ncbi:MAG: carbohydrate kinase family protein [Deltaproteobacteria bacterium]|jgi:sugar/nucleoside kinase (ribokinase family)|nr:carbohydrate kinase family protein [Deltaproteobacteria bacterium]MBW2501095.1 carbohydrate kinase family protein [Deltaproteobacteria bacterium]